MTTAAFFFTEVLSTVNEGLDKVVDALPIPNQPAKVGITVIGGLIVFGLVKQVRSDRRGASDGVASYKSG